MKKKLLVVVDEREESKQKRDLYLAETNQSDCFDIVDVIPFDENVCEGIKEKDIDFVLLDKEAALKMGESYLNEETNKAQEDYIVSKTRSGIKKILLKDVFYFKAEDKYVVVFYKGGKLLLNTSVSSLEKKYAGKVLRIHRKYLVFLSKIKELIRTDDKKNYLLLYDLEEKLPISRRQLSKVKEALF